jgi:hypothetical protein
VKEINPQWFITIYLHNTQSSNNHQTKTHKNMDTSTQMSGTLSATVPADTIQITLTDNSNLDPSVATVWVGGWINGGGSDDAFQMLQSDGSFEASSPQTVIVAANLAWQDSGIMVTQGSPTTLTITYVSGEWTADPNTNGGALYNAMGCPNLNVPDNQTAYPIVGVPMGALVGKIGSNGTPFLIGNGPEIVTSSTGGELYLCINDDLTGAYGAGLKDNSGSLNIAITQGLPFYAVSSVPTIDLVSNTNGNDRLIFIASENQPAEMPVFLTNPMQYTSYPYANTPGAGLAAPGPFDVFEFGFNAAADLTAVNGLGLNLSFSYNNTSYGVDQRVSRQQVGQAFQNFVINETKSNATAAAYTELFYNGSIGNGAPVPPLVGGQFFAIADPNDMLQAKMIQGQTASDALTSYWDDTMLQFFNVGNYLSINLGGSNTYSGQCTLQTNPNTNLQAPTFTLSNGTNSYNFYMPPAGLDSALYVFEQAFNNYTPSSNGDSGLLQDCIWEAFCRGVAMSGTSVSSITNGESTTAWNNDANWYQAGATCHLFGKFVHYSDIDGNDSRISAKSPIFYNNAAYGFSMDETPIGPYTGPNVPSKTGNIPGGSTISIVVGPWE